MHVLRPTRQFSLGAIPAVRTQIVVGQATRLPARTRLELLVALGSGVLSVVSLLMFATGRDKLGYMLGIGTALGGAIIVAAQLVGTAEEEGSPS